jgi:hypothetical protein
VCYKINYISFYANQQKKINNNMAQNRNICKSFFINGTNTKTKLADQECFEVIVRPQADYTFFDFRNPTVGFLVKSGTEFTFRGLTNSDQLSATGTGDLYYRTQFFGSVPGI